MPLDPFNLPERLNLAQVFLHAQAQRHPERTAVIFEDQRLSYAQVSDATHRAAAVFRGLGLEQEQRVLLMLPDVPQFASAWFGTVEMGGVVSAVNPGLKPDEVTYYLNYTRAKLVVTDAATAATIDAVLPRCPYVKHVLVAGGNAGRHLDYDAELERAQPGGAVADTTKEDVGVWLYTSGSTGFPKAAVHKHGDFVFNALTYGLPILGYGERDVCLSMPRLAFGYGLGTNLLFPFLAGSTVVLFSDKPTPEKFYELLAKHRPTVFTAVPTVLNQLLNAKELDGADFSSLRVARLNLNGVGPHGSSVEGGVADRWASFSGTGSRSTRRGPCACR